MVSSILRPVPYATEVEDDVTRLVTGVETGGGELHGADLFELAVDDHCG
jgi:hypothetical protein